MFSSLRRTGLIAGGLTAAAVTAALTGSAHASLDESQPARSFSWAIADSFVEENAPTANHGADRRLVASSAPGATKRIYLKFRVSGVQSQDRVSRAWLTLRGAGVANPDVRLSRVHNAWWRENALTWANRPKSREEVVGKLIQPYRYPSVDTKVFDVRDTVTRAGLYTFAVDVPAGSSDAVFISREVGDHEGTTGASLDVDYWPCWPSC